MAINKELQIQDLTVLASASHWTRGLRLAGEPGTPLSLLYHTVPQHPCCLITALVAASPYQVPSLLSNFFFFNRELSDCSFCNNFQSFPSSDFTYLNLGVSQG